MSDETTIAAAPVADKAPEGTTLAATATLAATVKALDEDVAKLKKQLKSVWAAVIVLIVVVIALAGFSVVPRMFGYRMMGGPAGFRSGQGFQPGQNGGQQGGQGGFQPGGQGAPAAPGQ